MLAMSFLQKLSVRISPKPSGNSNSYTNSTPSSDNLDSTHQSKTSSYNSIKVLDKSGVPGHKSSHKDSSLLRPFAHQETSEMLESNTEQQQNAINNGYSLAYRNSKHPLDTRPPSQTNPPGNRPTTTTKLSLVDFDICRTLGTGSFGRVHLVRSKHNQKYYALKVLKKTEVVRLKQVEHTNNEKRILEQINHPFLVKLWGTFQDSTNLYMVMDYIIGGELFSVLRRKQRFPDHVAKFYAAEVLLAFEFLHSKDIIYRDLKPENLLLDRNGHIKITDFGFSKHVPDVTWTLCGTPDYLAPEVIQSKGYGKAVDWYSLGILIFEMLAGCPPFYDDDHMRLYEKILAGRVRYPGFFEQTVKDLLKKLLTADLTKRFGNLRGGSEDIKRHDWFKGVDWDRLLQQEIEAPYIPHISGDGDASNFDLYPEERESYGKDCMDVHRDKFPSF